MNPSILTRRDALKRLSAAAGLTGASSLWPRSAEAADNTAAPLTPRRAKKIIVAGGGIGGLCAAYELMKLGHEVTVLEASGRAGGHVRTIHDPLPDGLYADLGAEQCTKPGYERYRQYAHEFGLELLPYPRRDGEDRYLDGKLFSEEMLADRKVLSGLGFNDREAEYLSRHEWHDLPLLFFGPYLDSFKDEYQPFGVGLDDLDNISVTDLLRREHASDAALRYVGGKETSALYSLWHAAILKHRGVPMYPKELFRIKGGNQRMTDAFSARLGARLRLGCPITKIVRGDSAVTLHFQEFGEDKRMEADYLVNAIPLPVLKRIPVEPAWPEAKAWVIENVAYNMQTRVVFVARTPFWKSDGLKPHLSIGLNHLYHVWEMADEVPGDRSILIGSAAPGTTERQALDAYRSRYPGKSVEIEHTIAHQWFMDRWAPVCERESFRVGQLAKFIPNIMEPAGRIHFVGAYADNLNWGMEAATRSANRVAKTIHAL
ncbi:MAG: FAD-dependent oxidoreductase [Verrucomicrobia bacterium]|nr:FAD-dependent oxidoreductase [Verrucomicrobiota bacterium]